MMVIQLAYNTFLPFISNRASHTEDDKLTICSWGTDMIGRVLLSNKHTVTNVPYVPMKVEVSMGFTKLC